MNSLLEFLSLSDFLWLRPWWLLALLPLPLLIWLLSRRQAGAGRWQDIIDSHLLRVLLQQGSNGNVSRAPLAFITLAWLLSVVALAGPSFRSQDAPLFQREQARVYVLDLSPSMNADDIKPSRLARARLKLLDALNSKRDGEQALLVYAGSAHVLTPLATDARTLAAQVPVLTSNLLPVSGNRPELALQRAVQMLHDAGHNRGEIMWLTDGIDADQVERVIDSVKGQGIQLGVLAIGSAEGAPVRQSNGSLLTDKAGKVVLATLDLAPLQAVVNAVGGKLTTLQADDSDWQALQFAEPELAGNTRRVDGVLTLREDAGAWLVLPLLIIVLLAFRRGSLLPVALLVLCTASPRSEAGWWQNLWQTPDQQAAKQLAAGDAKAAAQQFQNPDWRATAQYREGDFSAAAQGFAGHDANSQFNRGNALAKAGKLDEAIAQYDAALKQKPDFTAAKENRDAVDKLRQQQKQQNQQNQNQNGDQQKPEQAKTDPNKADHQQNGAGEPDANQQNPQQSAQNQQSQDQQNQQDKDNSSAQNPSGENSAQEKSAENGNDKQEAKQPSSAKPEDQAQAGAAQQAQPKSDDKSKPAQALAQDDDNTPPANERPMPLQLKQLPEDPGGLLRRKMKLEYLRRGQETQQQDQEQRW